MQQQPLHHAIPTCDLIHSLPPCGDEPKLSIREALGSLAQVTGALSLCWMLHVVL